METEALMSDRWVKRYVASIVLLGFAAIAIVWANATFPAGTGVPAEAT